MELLGGATVIVVNGGFQVGPVMIDMLLDEAIDVRDKRDQPVVVPPSTGTGTALEDMAPAVLLRI